MSTPNQFGTPGQPTFPSAGIPTPVAPKAKRGRRDKGSSPTRKVTSRATMFAGILALLAGVAVIMLLSEPAPPSTYVARTSAAVPAMSEMAGSNIEAIEIDDEYIEPDTITGDNADDVIAAATEAFAGRLARYDIAAGRQLRPSDFQTSTATVAELAPGERLVSVSANVSRSAAGTIRAGDRVDVVAVAPSGAEATNMWSNIIVADVEVVSVRLSEQYLQSLAQQQVTASNTDDGVDGRDALQPADPIPGTYVVRVSAQDAVLLANFDMATDLYLLVRGADASDVITIPVDLSVLLCAGGTQSDPGACPMLGRPAVMVSGTETGDLAND